MDFRDRLKDLISYHGFLLKEVADKAGIDKRRLDSYVDSRGIMPPADIAYHLAKALGVTVEYLVTGQDLRLDKFEEKKPPHGLSIDKKVIQVAKSDKISNTGSDEIKQCIETLKVQDARISMLEEERKQELMKYSYPVHKSIMNAIPQKQEKIKAISPDVIIKFFEEKGKPLSPAEKKELKESLKKYEKNANRKKLPKNTVLH